MKKPKTKPGKKKIEITPPMIKKIQELSGRGLNQKQIAGYFGMGKTTFQTRCKENPALRTAIRQGKSKVIDDIAGVVVRAAKKGNLTAACFYLKTQAFWRERSHLNIKNMQDFNNMSHAEQIKFVENLPADKKIRLFTDVAKKIKEKKGK